MTNLFTAALKFNFSRKERKKKKNNNQRSVQLTLPHTMKGVLKIIRKNDPPPPPKKRDLHKIP
jgi:hypothetical protein